MTFKIGDRVRTHTPDDPGGEYDNLTGTVHELCDWIDNYDCTVALPTEITPAPIVFKFSELSHLEPEPLAEWEKDLLAYGAGYSIYEEVVKAHGFDPMAGEGY